MHPWMLEQVAREHRRDLQALAAPSRRWMLPIRRRRGSPAAVVGRPSAGLQPAGSAAAVCATA